MYKKANARVIINNKFSHLFHCWKGVRQGCNLSPILFNLFISDLENHLKVVKRQDALIYIIIGNMKLQLLQFADDLHVVLLANNPKGLQRSLNV